MPASVAAFAGAAGCTIIGLPAGGLGSGCATCGSDVSMVSSGGGEEVPAYGPGWAGGDCCAHKAAHASARKAQPRSGRFILFSFGGRRGSPVKGLDPACYTEFLSTHHFQTIAHPLGRV